MKKLLLSLWISFISLALGASPSTGRFRSVPMPSGTMTSVFDIEQDASGFIWMGTDYGLIRYDGFGFRTYKWEVGDSLSLANNVVNDLLWCDGYLYVGTDKGVSIYDSHSDSFRLIYGTENLHVKGLLSDGDILYIASTTGLLKYDGDSLDRIADGHFTRVKNINGLIWATSYDSIFSVSDSGAVRKYDFEGQLKSNDVLVLDICEDKSDLNYLLLGTEAGLLRYSYADEMIEKIQLKNTPVKVFSYINDALYAGTDNGLAVFTRDGGMEIYRHIAQHTSSIPNNVVWTISEDKGGNVWLGTDHGAAIADLGSIYRYIGIDNITGKSDGLDVILIEPDSRGCLWLGGRDGLICCDESLEEGFWLKSDEGAREKRLSHNKVRGLYDDGMRMWIVSDGGLDYYDYGKDKVVKCQIYEPTGKFRSNWMYSVTEDSDGILWIGTYDGGLYGVLKSKVLSAAGPVLCDHHLSCNSNPALSSNIVGNVVIKGDVMYVESNNVINSISLETWELTRISLPDLLFVQVMTLCDGVVYVGTDKGLYRIDDGQLEKIQGCDVCVMSIAYNDGAVWVAGKESLSSYSLETGQWTHSYIDELPIRSVGVFNGMLYFGTVDGILEYLPSSNNFEKDFKSLAVTEFRLDDELVVAGMEYDGNVVLKENISFTEHITLLPDQNSFSFSLSSFDYGVSDVQIRYRLGGFDDRWRTLEKHLNKAVFINVPSGNYVFEYMSVDSMGRQVGELYSIDLTVKTVWYATTLAWIIYILIFIGIIAALVHDARMRQMLRIEHAERERAISMADSKAEFLANIAHEFKSPLSIILNLISRMTASESDSLKTNELKTVQKNAEKMHLLLNHMVEANENDSTYLFMPVSVSLVDLAREVWDGFAQAFKDKDISARFVSDDIGYIFMVDRVQMSMVFSNLLSNALKFTPPHGSVLMSVTVSSESSDMVYADVKVEDTGCGMTPEETSKIFNRHFMAPSGQGLNPSGNGIGLHIVKEVVDMHKGKILVSSESGKGSCFTVRLSTFKADSFVLKDAVDVDLSLHSLSRVWQHERKPIILLVEDNQDVRDFIIASLGKDYVFLTAEEGGRGLEILKTEKVDLVITDISMPGMDGLTMCRTIRNDIKTAFLPIIVLSGKSDMNTQIESYEYVDAFIMKPFDLNYLNGRIIQLLIKHEQYLSKIRQQKMMVSEPEIVESSDEKLLREVIEIINRHIDDSEFSVSILAQESHWSEKQIYRKVKQLTGLTVTELVRDIRLDKAAGYISQGKLTINEVMYKVGFTTASYFSKCFKAKFGVSPSEYSR